MGEWIHADYILKTLYLGPIPLVFYLYTLPGIHCSNTEFKATSSLAAILSRSDNQVSLEQVAFEIVYGQRKLVFKYLVCTKRPLFYLWGNFFSSSHYIIFTSYHKIKKLYSQYYICSALRLKGTMFQRDGMNNQKLRSKSYNTPNRVSSFKAVLL